MFEYLVKTFERLITAETVPPLYHDTVVLAICLTAIIVFREPIKALLSRLIKHKSSLFGEYELLPDPMTSKFLESNQPENVQPVLPMESSVPEKIEYFKSAHFYWLGSDLMEAIRSVAAVPNKEITIQALSQSLRHFKKVGLRDDAIEAHLSWLIDLNRKKLVSEWNSDESRRDILNEIVIAKKNISRLIECKAGPLFKPWED